MQYYKKESIYESKKNGLKVCKVSNTLQNCARLWPIFKSTRKGLRTYLENARKVNEMYWESTRKLPEKYWESNRKKLRKNWESRILFCKLIFLVLNKLIL